MGREIVALEDTEIRDQPVLTLLDDKLRKVLTAKNRIIALCLRPELECSIGLLEWLEAWNRKFRNAHKAFIIIPATPGQLECLEVSHPEMALRHVATLDELDIVAPQPKEPEPAPVPSVVPVMERQPPAQTVAVRQTTIAEPPLPQAPVSAVVFSVAEERKTSPVADNSLEYAPPVVHMKAGFTVKLCGEYVCPACKMSRMWLKGDKAAACENPECRNPSAGWDLTCELF